MQQKFQPGFRSLKSEVTLDQLPVRGTIPEWLSGALLRNGPALFEVGKHRYRHWFDGQAMLHRFTFRNGQVSYANRFLQSQAYLRGQQKRKIVSPEFGTSSTRSFLQRFRSVVAPAPADNASVNITQINNNWVALTETPIPVKFEPRDLRTLGTIRFEDDLKMQTNTPHPHYDFSRRLLINLGTHYARDSSYEFYYHEAGKPQRIPIGSIEAKEPSYIHAFSITENYLILAAYPLVFNPLSLALSGKPFIENGRWKEGEGTTFLVVSKQDGKVVKRYETESFFSFHHVNAYEKGNDIFVDISAYPDAAIIHEFYLGRMLGTAEPVLPASQLRRYHLPDEGKHADYEVLGPEQIDLPRINYKAHNGCDYRFAYGVSIRRDRPNDFNNQLVKINVTNGDALTWFEDDCYTGEPVFVPSPGSREEDGGVVLSVVLDGNRGKSFLLVLDGSTFEEIARADLPHPVPFGFHGVYAENI